VGSLQDGYPPCGELREPRANALRHPLCRRRRLRREAKPCPAKGLVCGTASVSLGELSADPVIRTVPGSRRGAGAGK